MNTSSISQNNNRLSGLDLARFVAFFGMVVVNFKVVMGAEGGTDTLSFLTGLVEGRAAATFVVLAGIGLGLSHLKNKQHTISVTVKRAVFLLVLGLVNTLIFSADIIHYYAFYFLIGVCLLSYSNRALIAAILMLNIAFVISTMVTSYDTGWDWTNYSYEGFWTPIGFIRNLFLNGWHPVIPWLGFLLFGIILSRISLSKRSTQIKLIIVGGLAIAVAEGLKTLITPALTAIDPELAFFASTQPIPPMPLYTLAGVGAASMVIGGCLLIAKHLERFQVMRFVVPAGRQTLTLYFAHILIGMGTLEALGLLSNQTITTVIIASAIFCVGATIYAFIWNIWFKRGPIEALMRKLAG